MRIKFLILLIACALAAAGAAIDVFASEDVGIENTEPILPTILPSDAPISSPEGEFDVQYLPTATPNIASESESLGEFGTDDTTVNDSFQDLIDSVEDAGFDFVSPSPDLDTSPLPDVFPSSSPSPTPFLDFEGDDFEPFSSYNTYYGGISSTYLEFMRGFLPKLGFNEHYVASRTSQYNYIFAYGEDLSFTGSAFYGTDITVITWNTYNTGTYSYGTESSFSLYPGSYLVYSDLSEVYPSLADTAGFTLRQILILLTTFILGVVIDHMYQVRKIRRVNLR